MIKSIFLLLRYVPVLSISVVCLLIHMVLKIGPSTPEQYALVTFVLLQIALNWITIFVVNVFVTPVIRPTEDQRTLLKKVDEDDPTTLLPAEYQNAHHCSRCDSVVKARSRHCPLCKRCYYLRDHHCFVIGTCVAHSNYKHFVVFCFYSGIGSLLALYYLASYMNQIYHRFRSVRFIYYFGPVAFGRWLSGNESLYNLIFVCLFNLSISLSCASLGYFALSMVQIVCNKLYFSLTEEQTEQAKTVKSRFVFVFGKCGFFNFIFPTSLITVPFQHFFNNDKIN